MGKERQRRTNHFGQPHHARKVAVFQNALLGLRLHLAVRSAGTCGGICPQERGRAIKHEVGRKKDDTDTRGRKMAGQCDCAIHVDDSCRLGVVAAFFGRCDCGAEERNG